MPRAPDRHALYEAAVQSPERDVEAISAIFRARARRDAVSLREDFCGTARLAIAWVGSDDDRTAEARDLDRECVSRARRSARDRLDDDERARLSIERRDVTAPSARSFDLILAPNFSWAILDDRDLARYLACAARALEHRGMLVLEIFGGSDLHGVRTHRHARDGFTYVWEQRAFVDDTLEAHLHFELDDGTILRDAFTYSFHLRSHARLRAMLEGAGLSRVELLVESRGRFAKTAREPRRRSWNGYVVASSRSSPSSFSSSA